MSSNYELSTQSRDSFGTGASRRQRRENLVPAVVYGAGKDNESVMLDHDQVMHSLEKEAFHSAIIDLKTDKGSQQVILREVQMHPHRQLVMHVDFQRVRASEKLHMKVPLHFEGSDVAPGVKTDGGILSHPITELDITCLPRDLPEFIAVDVSELNLNESLHLSNIKMPEGVELTATAFPEGEDPTIATISPPKVVEEEVVEEAADQEAGVDAKSADAEDAGEA
ncbi:MAG: 50S ribosomal protein L25/general stress protein Ctc [Arenicellales bacterium]|jgi:large subunit ribosomal protein L25|nr:50S ribosomal protein L25/general stress protein Ctc [Arenicellales bacterium]MDC1073158.1 50S ribosomal protein L25/general stress protein Ctc [Gammaproteobacteria bacterium]MDC3280078.1 50S ribosomal protein L25/general stress protein Ctc [Gammaproteobacteria bacterium]MDG1193103.1 50S ribosomal protein L25/general stress protein Ctc [Arenicellales bacterium]